MAFPPFARPIETDVLVVGGGVVGCALAYFLAKEGVEVVLIDRFDLNTQASGTNAGSIHVQMMNHFAHEPDPERRAAAAAALPLWQQGSRLWRELAGELGADIEYKVAGGLMAAETEAQVRFLEEKAEIERANGIETEILYGNALRTKAPYLSERVIAADFCPDEGKVNPLLATQALVRGAERRGARFERHAELKSVERLDRGFRATTARGDIRCARLVNAAGAWAGRVAALVGVELPLEFLPLHVNVSEGGEYIMPHLLQHADAKLTLKQGANGTWVIGGGWPATVNPASGHPGVVRDSIQGNLWIAARMVPALLHSRIVRTWAGVLPLGDGAPYLGEVAGARGFFLAAAPAGYTGGPFCARLVAEEMCGKSPTYDVRPFAAARLAAGARWPGRGYRWDTYPQKPEHIY